MKCCVVIPAYEPGESFVPYVQELLAQGQIQVLAVDDGSGESYAWIFQALERLEGCTVLRHPVNRGKGAALKTAFTWYLEHLPKNCPGVVTADCDGQHRVEDVLAVQSALVEREGALILGSRDFGPDTPARSLSGNRASAAALSLLYGIRLRDTQTGLRGIPNRLLTGLCQMAGERFEYELNMLVYARQQCVDMVEIPIQTIYFDNNRGSHFRTFADAGRIVLVLLGSVVQYAGAAALSVVIDVGVYALMVKALLTPLSLSTRIFFSTVIARVLSSTANYACNRTLPYVQNKGVWSTLWKYYVLWLCQLCASFGGTWLLTEVLGVDELLGKLLVDIVLAVLSYQVQLRWVFRAERGKEETCRTSASMEK